MPGLKYNKEEEEKCMNKKIVKIVYCMWRKIDFHSNKTMCEAFPSEPITVLILPAHAYTQMIDFFLCFSVVLLLILEFNYKTILIV